MRKARSLREAELEARKHLAGVVEAAVANGRRLRSALVDFGFGELAARPEELAQAGPGWTGSRLERRRQGHAVSKSPQQSPYVLQLVSQ